MVRTTINCFLAAMVCISVALAGEPPASPASPPEANESNLDQLSNAEILKLLRDLANELRETREEVKQLKAERAAEKEAAETRKRLSQPAPSAPPVAPRPSPPIAAEPPAVASSPTTPVPIEEGGEKPEAEEERARLERERAIRSVQRSGVLLPRGKFEVETDLTYSHFSSNLISIDGFSILPVLVVGEIESLRIERDVLQSTMTLRYGIVNRLQADVSVPYRYEQDRFVRQVQQNEQLIRSEKQPDDHGIGDVQFGLSFQALHEHGWVPDLILSSRARAPTGKSLWDIDSPQELPQGAGVWGVRSGITAIKAIDPVVVIFNAGYTYNFGRDISVTVIDPESEVEVPIDAELIPGGTVDISVAVAIALNPSFAINLGVQERITTSTELEGFGSVEATELNEAELRFGFAWALTRNSSFNFTASAGLTEDSPDITITLAWPVRF
jgi:hypothetical protein